MWFRSPLPNYQIVDLESFLVFTNKFLKNDSDCFPKCQRWVALYESRRPP